MSESRARTRAGGPDAPAFKGNEAIPGGKGNSDAPGVEVEAMPDRELNAPLWRRSKRPGKPSRRLSEVKPRSSWISGEPRPWEGIARGGVAASELGADALGCRGAAAEALDALEALECAAVVPEVDAVPAVVIFRGGGWELGRGWELGGCICEFGRCLCCDCEWFRVWFWLWFCDCD
jgi:hypothetical protein